jgi:hypothetical protein
MDDADENQALGNQD